MKRDDLLERGRASVRRDLGQYQRDLAQKIARADKSSSGIAPISVVAGSTVYQINPAWVDFVENIQPITPVPLPDRFVLGVCRVRGRVLQALDLAKALGVAERPGSKIIAIKGRDIAIVAPLATAQERSRLQALAFEPSLLGANARLLSHLQ